LIVHRSCDQHGEEGRQRQRPDSATGELHHQLSDCDADDYPINNRTAFDPLRPTVALRPTIAAIGAKKGSECPARCTAIIHAITAAAVCCAIGQTE
jgi:hypothetical protein